MAGILDAREHQKAQWSAAAAAWDRWFDAYTRKFQPLIGWSCDAVHLAAGARLLDVACGAGQPAFEAAGRVQPGGAVVGVDLSPDMVRFAARRAAAAGAANLQFLEMDAERLQFEDRAFDAVTCICGLMFFPNPARALAEMHRVVKPGGRIAVAVWDDPSKSPFFTVAGGALAQVSPPPSDGKAPAGPRFSRPGVLEGLLREAGFREVTIESRPMPIEFPSAADYWHMFSEMGAVIKDQLDAVSEADRARLQDLVAQAAAPYMNGPSLQLTATPLCAAGTKG